jgi:hypothetical protein
VAGTAPSSGPLSVVIGGRIDLDETMNRMIRGTAEFILISHDEIEIVCQGLRTIRIRKDALRELREIRADVRSWHGTAANQHSISALLYHPDFQRAHWKSGYVLIFDVHGTGFTRRNDFVPRGNHCEFECSIKLHLHPVFQLCHLKGCPVQTASQAPGTFETA